MDSLLNKAICQACHKSRLLRKMCDVDIEFLVCKPCRVRLNTQSLRPIEWYNLASIHGWNTYLLHDDFYDEEGVSYNVDVAKVDKDLLAPTFEEVSSTLEQLIGYCMTRWSLGSKEYKALGMFPSFKLLTELSKLSKTQTHIALSVIFAISANVLGLKAEKLIRELQYHTKNNNLLFSFAEAAAACLPPPEGLDRIIGLLERMGDRDIYNHIGALVWFRSEKVLAWIEHNPPKRLNGDNWGRVAAASNLSWGVTQSWLDRGRPLSLIALDGLVSMIPRTGMSHVLTDMNLTLVDCPNRRTIKGALEQYILIDDVPRVTKKCAYIIKNLDKLGI